MKEATRVSMFSVITALAPLAPLAPLTPLAPLLAPLAFTPAAHAQELIWGRQFGTIEWDQAWALAPDGTGGVMVGGGTWGDLGAPNAGEQDAFLGRYDRFGNQLWMRQFGTSETDRVVGIAPDGAGGVMITGSTTGNLGGPSAGGHDAYVARYDGAGNQIWLEQFGTSADDFPFPMASDGAGGVFVGGVTRGSLAGPINGPSDAFLARYDGDGNQRWIRQFGTSLDDWVYGLAPDGSGGVIVAGTQGDLDPFGTANDIDVFLIRYDSEGNRLWELTFGTSSEDWAQAATSDDAGGVYVAGYTLGNLGGSNQGGNSDPFLAHYDGAGNQLWIRQFGTRNSDSALALAPDGAGGVIVAGATTGDLGGPNAGGRNDVFLAGYDSAGNQLWVSQFGTSEYDLPNAVAPDGAGGVIVTGRTASSLGGPSAGSVDTFLFHYGDAGCYQADCDWSTGVGVLDLFDFLCFQGSFVSGEAYACDCDTSTGPLVCDLFDFLCFQDAFVEGCP